MPDHASRAPLWTVKRVADHLSVSPRSVYQWIRDGELQAVRVAPQTLRITSDDLRAFLSRRRIGTRMSDNSPGARA